MHPLEKSNILCEIAQVAPRASGRTSPTVLKSDINHERGIASRPACYDEGVAFLFEKAIDEHPKCGHFGTHF